MTKDLFMRYSLAAAMVATSLAATAAYAQTGPYAGDNGTYLRGIRVEGNAGGDWFKSQGISDNRFGYGATVGFDGVIAHRIVIGPEGSYWNPNHRSQNCTTPSATSIQCDREGREFGAAVRAGYLVSPALLVFGKGGYVNAEQSGSYSNSAGFYTVNGNLVGPGFSSYRRTHTDGYQLGGGAEYTLYHHVYVDAQYVYSRYDDHTRRERVMGGVGVRF